MLSLIFISSRGINRGQYNVCSVRSAASAEEAALLFFSPLIGGARSAVSVRVGANVHAGARDKEHPALLRKLRRYLVIGSVYE